MKCNFSNGKKCALAKTKCDGEKDKLGCPYWELIRALKKEPLVVSGK
jgi:hypothetical protein